MPAHQVSCHVTQALPQLSPCFPLCTEDTHDFRAETLSFFTRRKTSTFSITDVKPLPNALRPFVTFEAAGRLYFVQGETFDDKALLRRLVGRPLKPSEEAQPIQPLE